MVRRGVPDDLIHGDAKLVESRPERPRTIDFLPYVFPPDNFVPFDVVWTASLALSTSATQLIYGPIQAYGVIRWFGNEGGAAADYTFLRWTINIGGVPYQPYVAMILSRGTVDNPDPIIIRVQPNQVVSVTVQNTDGAGAHVHQTRVKGWLY
jgi:hypothetical protein